MQNAKLIISAKKELVFSKGIQFGCKEGYLLIGPLEDLKKFLKENDNDINEYYFDIPCVNSRYPLIDLSDCKARVEPSAIIRKGVFLADDAIVLMGAVINLGATIGSKTMIDMNAVIGSGAIIGSNCHIGAGSVIAGIMEPVNSHPVTIKNGVLIGANATVLAGVTIGDNAIVGAGAVVTKDVNANETVVGIPARVIKVSNGGWERNDRLR